MSGRGVVGMVLCGGLAVGLAALATADYVPGDPMRFTVWNPGLNAVGGIPHRTTVCATVAPSGGEDSGAIQAAIDGCPVGQVVQLTAGTFTVNTLVLVDKAITLRGAGPGQTLLKKTNGAQPNVDSPGPDAEPLVIIGPGRWPWSDDSTSRNLTADAPKGATAVTITDATGFVAGRFVLLDELSGASWQPDRMGQGQVWASPDYRVVWQLHNPPLDPDDPLEPTTPTSGSAASWFCRQDRPTTEIKEIASVAGNVVTFTTPLHTEYRASHAAQLTRYPGNEHVKYAGVEDLAVWGGSDGGVRLMTAAYSWFKNIEVSVWKGEGVAISDSFRCELRDSYIHDAAYSSPGGGAYAISLEGASSEILIENNVSVRANKVMVARCAGAGSVVGYNYMDQGFITYDENWIEAGINASHMVGPHHVLFEGNYGFNWESDFTHGNSTYHTIFRNWLRGVRAPFTNPDTGHIINDDASSQSGPKRCAGAGAYSGWMTFVGNVMGAAGHMAGWVYDASGPDGWDTPGIWLLGWDHELYDDATHGTALRVGNWDWVQGQQTWHDSTPVTLQDSLYLSGKPAFFGDNPWPWVDPTTGTTYVLPAKVRFDAIQAGEHRLSVAGGSATEGDSGTTELSFSVTLQ